MKTRNIVFAIIAIAAGVVLWALFRPERLVVNKRVNESFPDAAATSAAPAQQVLASGSFHGVAHSGAGKATIYQFADGKRVLRFTQFSTSNGPDLWVYLVAANDASDSESVKKAAFVTLGALKGNQGDQNYEIPADVDLGKYRAVTVWCRRFSVNFVTAPLTPNQG